MCILSFVAVPGCFRGSVQAAWPDIVRQDWAHAEEVAAIVASGSGPIRPQDDATGGCDGIINGEFGFHTAQMPNPWWQVDLGKTVPIDKLVIWNRTSLPERAARIQVLLSSDGSDFRSAYIHDGTTFMGFADKRPLTVNLSGAQARFVRLMIPGTTYFHLDEVEVFGADGQKNQALHKPATQSGVSQWSVAHQSFSSSVDWKAKTLDCLKACEKMAGQGTPQQNAIRKLKAALSAASPSEAKAIFFEARAVQRELALANPLLRQFDTLLFTKRVPGSFNHMSDQFYGWWSKLGGGIYLLRNFLSGTPSEICLTTAFKEPGSFLRPSLSYDAKKVLFAWCKHYPHLAAEPNKLDKSRVPEDAFYHLFEMNLDGSGLRQLTRGTYDDFDGRYLPDGRIVFLSTRRGQSLQVDAATTGKATDPGDCYVRCGGGPERPVAVYTLHTMNSDGSEIRTISPFEMFEWTPEIAHDGTILHSRWDYIDRSNMPFMGLWAINPDGTNPRSIFKNYMTSPHCTFEARPIPGSTKIIFTASAHHSQTMGSLVLLDPSAGTEGQESMKRLTPEVPFPEAEGWPLTYYASPFPLSERFYLVSWGAEGIRSPGPEGWSRWHAVQRPPAGMALYLYDAELRTRELIWADTNIACVDPTPMLARACPPILAPRISAQPEAEGSFFLTDVYHGLTNVQRGEIKRLRIVAVPPKTHPTMNLPEMGLTADDPGKCVLGTVPVEADGSAFFRVPSGVIVFFQALNEAGIAVQTMRSATHVQPGQTLSCIGCHENRQQAPPVRQTLAVARPASRPQPGPEGSWPLRFDRLVQPVLDARCVQCHVPGSTNFLAAKTDLRPLRAYNTLVNFGKPSVRDQVRAAYNGGFSTPGNGIAQQSRLWRLLDSGHQDVVLSAQERERLLTWLDTYAQRLGSFDKEQEEQLIQLKRTFAGLPPLNKN